MKKMIRMRNKLFARAVSLLLVLVLLLEPIPVSAAINQHALRASSKIQVYSQWDVDAYGGYDNNWINTSGCGWFTIGHMLQWLGIIPRDQENRNSVLYQDLFVGSGYIRTNTNIAGAMKHVANLYKGRLQVVSGWSDLGTILRNGGVAFIHRYGHYYAAVDISADGQYVHIVDSCMMVPSNNGVAIYQYDASSGTFQRSTINASAARLDQRWYCGTGWVMQKAYNARGGYAGGDYWVKIGEVSGYVKYAFYKLHDHAYTNGVCACGGWDTSTFHVKKDYSGAAIISCVTATKDTVLRTGPYGAVDEGKISIPKGTQLELQQTGYNAYGTSHVWHKVKYNGASYYIYSDNVGSSHYAATNIAITINSPANNQQLTVGSSCSLTGVITSAAGFSKIETVLASSDNELISYKKITNSPGMSYVIAAGGVLDKGMKNSELSLTGTYTLRIKVTDKNGGTKTETRTVKVVPPAAPVQPQCVAPSVTYSDAVGGKRVTITQNTPGATLYYSYYGTSGTASTTNSSVSFLIDRYAEVYAYSAKSGMKTSARTSRIIHVEQLATPAFSVETTGNNALVTIRTNETAGLRYSLDGISYQNYAGAPVELTESSTIYAYATRSGYKDSEVVTKYVGLTAPAAPAVSLSVGADKVAQNTAVMISWDKVPNALTYTVKCYRDGALNEVIVNLAETSKTLVLEEAGEYCFTVTAHNKFGDSEESRSRTLTAVAPLTVRFVDWDGSVLSEQRVDYGTSATTPPDPERTGYYFQRWNQSFSSVTEDLTVTPEYAIITYAVNYLNADGERIKTEYVDYGHSANPPVEELVPPGESFCFAGWSISAEAADSKCDLSFIDSNMTVQAVFNWANADLPVTITDVDATWDGSSYYTVKVSLENMPDRITTAMLRVSLKTAEDKMVKTESRTVQIMGGDTEEVSVSLNYTGVATVAEAIVLGYDGDYLTGSTYAKAVASPVTAVSDYAFGNWSEWSLTAPAEQEGREIERKTQYRYQTKETTTSPNSSLSGWTQYGAPTVSYSAWGSESAWVSTKPAESDTLRITDTRVVTDRAAYTVYNYYHYYGYNSSGALYNSYGNTYWKNYEAVSSTSPYPYYQTFDGYPAYKASVSGKHGNVWWLASTSTVPAQTHSEWRYQTRSQYNTYSYYRWSEWSAWQDAALSATGERNVETQILYRYRDQDVPVYGSVPSELEDKSGELYEFEGVLPVDASMDLAGRNATVMVYKGKNSDPNESQLQYVGQIVIGEDNAYSLRFKTKEAPSISSGDYVVAMSLEGSTGLINAEIIEAPVPEYTVNFLSSIDGSLITTQEGIREGSSVPMPEAPEIDGYRFITWDHSGTNIRGDANIGTISITAHYVPETYAVAFVDYINDEVLLFASEYGTRLSDLAAKVGTPEAEGHRFLGWDYDEYRTVTGNVVISALYEPEMFTVTFHNSDYSVYETRQVPYGGSAELPEAPEAAGKTFLGWSTEVEWWNVHEDLHVYPIFVYEDSAMRPVSDVVTEYNGENVTITLSAEPGATIYYTLDGSEPDTSSEEYTGPITLTGDEIIRAIAIVPNKNNSDVLEVCFDFTMEDPGSDALPDAVEIGTYNIMAEPGKETTVQIRMDENPGLVGYLFMIECDSSVFYVDCDEETGFALAEPGSVSSEGTMFCAPYGDAGWQVLWFSETASEEAGTLFSLTLKVSEEAEAGTYPVKISYSPANTVTEDAVEMSGDSLNVLLSGDTALLGDVNSDGDITTVDVVRIARYLIDDLTLTRSQLAAADVNGDGKVTAADVIRLARYIVGLAELG